MLKQVAILLLVSMYGCTFKTEGLLYPVDDIGGRCIQLGMRFTPTFDNITTDANTPPALSIDQEYCSNYAEQNNIGWVATRMEPPSPTSHAFPLNSPDWVQIEYDNGVPYCVYRRSISHEFMPENGFGTWQFTHSAGDWSTTCPALEVETSHCSSSITATSDFWATYTTVSKNDCTQQIYGVDFPDPIFP